MATKPSAPTDARRAASWFRTDLIYPFLSAFVAAWLVFFANYWIGNRQMDVKMVEIAVGILSQEPKEHIKPARQWAVDIISFYSTDVKLSSEVKDALVNNQVVIISNYGGFYVPSYNSTYTPGYNSTFTPKYDSTLAPK